MAAVHACVEKTVSHFVNRISKMPELSNQSTPHSSNELASTDIRLDSFVAYLLKNGLSPQSTLVELAVLEQFAHPALEANDVTISTFRKCAETCLNQVPKWDPKNVLQLILNRPVNKLADR
jgi:hypothetical protein